MQGAAADWSWGGARWWKCDLHTHTPASDDYGKGPRQAELRARSPRKWLLDHMEAGLDCVAVTDHNSGAWIDGLKGALAELEGERPDGFRPLHLFPGVEISVNGGVHVLAILGPERTTSDIDSLLGAVGFPSDAKGSSNSVTSKSLAEVVRVIEGAGGIAIPAHVDCRNGLFELPGTTLAQGLDCEQIFAMEVCDASFQKPSVYEEKKRRWTEVVGSDSHHPTGDAGQRYPGSHFTWIKMGSPTLEGLRLALLDGSLSVRRSDEEPGDPNQHGPLVLESVEVTDAHYMGQAEPFALHLNPWLNAIVGGRGTGKSTVVEFLRLALRRERELPQELRDDMAMYRRVYPREGTSALLRDDTVIRVVYRKDASRFRIQWRPGGSGEPIEEEVEGRWRRAAGDVHQRFPVRMFSQKQIFHLANRPRALLDVVDQAPEVDRHSWRERIKEMEAQFLSLRARAREIETGLADVPRLQGELDDVKRKLKVFEDAGHSDVLKAYQRRRRQQRAVEVWDESWAEAGSRLRRSAEDLVPEPLDESEFDAASGPDRQLLETARETRSALNRIRERLEGLADRVDEVLANWRGAREESAWLRSVQEAETGYAELQQRLVEEEAGDPTAYGELVQRRQTIERRLGDLEARGEQVEDLRKQAGDRLTDLLKLRQGLTRAREQFLDSILEDNPFVRISLLPYQAVDTVDLEFRKRIQKEDSTFERDIGTPEGGGLLGELYEGTELASNIVEERLRSLKARVREVADGRYERGTLSDERFANHLGTLQPETLDRLDLWFPEDSLKVEYSPSGDGRDFRPIEEGSPGQKTAALLAFLLSYGEEPLILDQPEDDLDNHLIYELIVNQLREVKRRRQILVVTHNPNIVVNGDAELVVALASGRGETRKEAEGSLQDRAVRDTICKVMEGGREAFDQRYRRIALEGRRVR